MRTVIVTALAVCLLPAFTATAIANSYGHKRHRHHDRGYERYPHATERQRANSYAFDNGGYYESDYTQHVFGSRSWWMLQQGRGGGGRH